LVRNVPVSADAPPAAEIVLDDLVDDSLKAEIIDDNDRHTSEVQLHVLLHVRTSHPLAFDTSSFSLKFINCDLVYCYYSKLLS